LPVLKDKMNRSVQKLKKNKIEMQNLKSVSFMKDKKYGMV
jgi:hypothetical protein